MKIYHNKKSQILIVTALIVSVATTLFGATQSFYPNIYETPQLSSANKTLLDTKELETFLSTWKIDGMQLIEDVENQIEQHSKALQSLQSVVRIQDAQVEQAKRERLPKISFVNTPTAPLYGYSTFTSDSVPVTVTTHSFSLATGITQKLPTAGTLDLSLSNVSSYSTANGGTDWTWKQTPSATLSISQPLFINEKVVDGTLASKALEKVELQQEESFEALLATGESLTKQGVALLHTYQNLYENRWLLYKEAYLSEQALEDSKESLTAGLVSENQLVGQRNTYQQLLIQLQSLENEIAALGSSLEQLGFQEPFTPPQIDIEDITFVLSYKGSALLDNEDNLAMALEHDSDYQSALRTLKTAQLDAALGNGSDAPIFKVSMSYSPYYSSTTGNSFGESFTDLFSSSTKNNVSVSVSLIATDLSRSLSKTTKTLAEEQLLQAQLGVQSAKDSVVEKLRALQEEINGTIDTLTVNTSAYTLADAAVENEMIKASVGLSDEVRIERSEIQKYRSAFTLLSSIRKIYELKLELESFLLL